MDKVTEEVKKRIDIIDFIGSCLSLKKAGRNFRALCPFHQEKTPSLMISPDRQIWYCFGACKTGGDVISFLMKWENLTFYEALKTLAEKAGVAITKVSFEDQAWQRKERLLALNQAAFEFYRYLLEKHSFGQQAQEYLKQRRVTAQIRETFGLGYGPSSWNSLVKFLAKKGFSPAEGVEAGLFVRSETGRMYDRFRGRLIFPIYNPSGQIIGFSGRALTQGKEAKYINTPETPLYHKRETLFGIHLAKENIRKAGAAVLVEGEFDLISLFSAGVTNVVAVKGSAVTREQLMLLKRYAKKIILCLDADFSGRETTKKAITEAEQLDYEISVAVFGAFKDPDEAIRADTVQFKKNLAAALPIYDFIMDTARARYPGDDAFAKKNLADEAIPFLIPIRNPIVKSHYVKKLAELLDVETRSVESLMNKMKWPKIPARRPAEKKITEKNRLEILQQYLLHRILHDDDPHVLIKKHLTHLTAADFSLVGYQKLFQEILSYTGIHDAFDLKRFVGVLPKELLAVFDMTLLFDVSVIDASLEEKTLARVGHELKRLSLKKRLAETISQEAVSDETIAALMKELSEVEKKLAVV